MSNLPTSFLHVFDGNGDPYAGAKLHTYQGGTSTPKATYSTRASAELDDGATNANANPVVADADGRFGEIYLVPEVAYKLELKTSADVLVWTDDDVYANQIADGQLTTRLKQGFASPLDYPEAGVDAVGDGVADEYQQVQNAIDATTGVVDLLGKTFRCDTTITVKSGLTIRNGTLNFSSSASNSYIYGAGTTAVSTAFGADASRGDLTITVSVADGLAADDWLVLYSALDPWTASNYVGEMVQIHSIAGTTVTLKAPLENSYTVANGASFEEISFLSNVRFENVKVIASTSAGGTGLPFYFQYCKDIQFLGCMIEGIKATGITLDLCVDGVVNNCILEESASGGKGVAVSRSQDVCVFGNTTRRVTNPFEVPATNVLARNVWFSENRAYGCKQGVALLGGHLCHVIDNRISCDASGDSSDGNGIVCQAPDTYIRGNHVWDAGGHGVNIDLSSITSTDGAPWGVWCDHNMVRDCDDDGISFTDIGIGSVSHNTIVDPGEHGISGADSDNLSIVGNSIEGVDTAGDYCMSLVTTAGDELRNITIAGNTCVRDDDLASNIYVSGNGADDVVNLVIVGNVLENGTYGVDLTNVDADTVLVDDNQITGMATGEVAGYRREGRGSRRLLTVTFDATGGKAIGTHSSTVTLPNNAIITHSYYEVVTTFTSDGADAGTLSIGIDTDDAAGIVAAIAISDGSNPWDAGYFDAIQNGTAATFSTKTTADRTIDFVIATQNFTAGKLVLFLEYVVSD